MIPVPGVAGSAVVVEDLPDFVQMGTSACTIMRGYDFLNGWYDKVILPSCTPAPYILGHYQILIMNE